MHAVVVCVQTESLSLLVVNIVLNFFDIFDSINSLILYYMTLLALMKIRAYGSKALQ